MITGNPYESSEGVQISTPGNTGPKYNQDEVYKVAFGHARPPYPTLLREGNGFGFIPGAGAFRALKGSFKLRSTMNADFTCPTIFKWIGKGGVEERWQVPQEPTAGVALSKNIIETPLTRIDPKTRRIQKQNVLEEINLNNYQVKIKGIILNEVDFDSYPEDDVRLLHEICSAPGNITIENFLVNQYGISKIVIQRADFFEVKGYIGAQAFELDCLSDEDFDLEIRNDVERI